MAKFLNNPALLIAAVTVFVAFSSPSMALSDIKREEVPETGTVLPDDAAEDAGEIPLPADPVPGTDDIAEPDGDSPQNTQDHSHPEIKSDTPLPEVLTDFSLLPAPARRMRELIMEAIATGNVELLRPMIGTGSEITQLSLGGIDGDPINFLREVSGDGEGHEILAILQEVLEAGFVRMDAGTEHEIYVWPYFFAYPLDQLGPVQRVELFRIVTGGDYEDMKEFGGYNFYRAGITPEGQWAFFVAGD